LRGEAEEEKNIYLLPIIKKKKREEGVRKGLNIIRTYIHKKNC
jgi:hypothetical protein